MVQLFGIDLFMLLQRRQQLGFSSSDCNPGTCSQCLEQLEQLLLTYSTSVSLQIKENSQELSQSSAGWCVCEGEVNGSIDGGRGLEETAFVTNPS